MSRLIPESLAQSVADIIKNSTPAPIDRFGILSSLDESVKRVGSVSSEIQKGVHKSLSKAGAQLRGTISNVDHHDDGSSTLHVRHTKPQTDAFLKMLKGWRAAHGHETSHPPGEALNTATSAPGTPTIQTKTHPLSGGWYHTEVHFKDGKSKLKEDAIEEELVDENWRHEHPDSVRSQARNAMIRNGTHHTQTGTSSSASHKVGSDSDEHKKTLKDLKDHTGAYHEWTASEGNYTQHSLQNHKKAHDHLVGSGWKHEVSPHNSDHHSYTKGNQHISIGKRDYNHYLTLHTKDKLKEDVLDESMDIKHGAFHRWLGKKEDEPITSADIEKGIKAGGHPAKMAEFAKNAKHFVHEDEQTVMETKKDDASRGGMKPPAGMSWKEYYAHEYGEEKPKKLKVGGRVEVNRQGGKGTVHDIYSRKIVTGATKKFMHVKHDDGKEEHYRIDTTPHKILESVDSPARKLTTEVMVPDSEQEDLPSGLIEAIVLKNEGYGFGGTIKGDRADHVKKIAPHLKKALTSSLADQHSRDAAAKKLMGSSSSAAVERSKLKVGSKMMGHFLDSSHGRHLADHLNSGIAHDDPKMHAHLKQSTHHFLKDYHPKQFAESVEIEDFEDDLIEEFNSHDQAITRKEYLDKKHPRTMHEVVQGRRSGKYFVVRRGQHGAHVAEAVDFPDLESGGATQTMKTYDDPTKAIGEDSKERRVNKIKSIIHSSKE